MIIKIIRIFPLSTETKHNDMTPDKKIIVDMQKHIDQNGIKLLHVADKVGIDRNRFYSLMNGTGRIKIAEYEEFRKYLEAQS